ncbi:hypothetical protein Ahy_Scaffold5g107739 [Arachis hypogaea]|uniref:CCHC-type domain-containing protein n=1 Tax=Arachis hypogaea TaxID=3818 RepID=A0A444WQ24_ARAHY|nr:hypothetical protein Ahy_Scaffold5g107739 [Arachis hypogaea]
MKKATTTSTTSPPTTSADIVDSRLCTRRSYCRRRFCWSIGHHWPSYESAEDEEYKPPSPGFEDDTDDSYEDEGLMKKTKSKGDKREKKGKKKAVEKKDHVRKKSEPNHTVGPNDKSESNTTAEPTPTTGIPCVHALEAIQKRCDKPESYVHPWLKIDTFRATYEHVIKLVNLEKYWVKTGLLSPKPPTIRRPIGCSTKKVNPVENTHDRTKGRRTSNVTCQKCSEAGHNAKTCKGQPRPKPHQRIRIIKRVMKVDPPLHQGHRKKYKPHLAPVTIPTPHVTLVLAPRPSPPPTLTLAPTVSFAPVPRSLHPNHIPRVSSETIAATSIRIATRIFKFMSTLELKLQKKK